MLINQPFRILCISYGTLGIRTRLALNRLIYYNCGILEIVWLKIIKKYIQTPPNRPHTQRSKIIFSSLGARSQRGNTTCKENYKLN